MAVFLLGIGLLCFVFSVAWTLFRSPVPGLDLPVKPTATPPPAAGIGIALTAFVRQLLLLALMTLAGSLVAGRGIQLYFSAQHTQSALSDTPASPKNGQAPPAPAGAASETPSKPPSTAGP
jgi:hypothetical protein